LCSNILYVVDFKSIEKEKASGGCFFYLGGEMRTVKVGIIFGMNVSLTRSQPNGKTPYIQVMKKVLTLFFGGLISYFNSYGQDSMVVFQQGASMFSNKYIFYRSSPFSDDYYSGTFKHYYETDDGQTWYGHGTYTDKGNKRILRFGDPDLTTKLEFGKIHYESNFERSLKISGKRFLSKDYYGTTRKKMVVFSNR
jgi:hypothetical protein